REFWVLAPVIVFIIWIGVYPNTFLRFLDTPSAELIERMSSRAVAERTMEPEYYGGDEPSGVDAESAVTGEEEMGDSAAAGMAGAPPDSADADAPPPPPVGSPGSVTR
ncbi:MAG TPA: hypothetical protein VFU59_02175, partial [Candidatus Eisenbacteria bacterium]|nr:hypothetical protein [Candidatus Eisenbacteria bacterium]